MSRCPVATVSDPTETRHQNSGILFAALVCIAALPHFSAPLPDLPILHDIFFPDGANLLLVFPKPASAIRQRKMHRPDHRALMVEHPHASQPKSCSYKSPILSIQHNASTLYCTRTYSMSSFPPPFSVMLPPSLVSSEVFLLLSATEPQGSSSSELVQNTTCFWDEGEIAFEVT